MQVLQVSEWLLASVPLWLIMSAFPSLAYAISNLLDKHQLEKLNDYFDDDGGVSTLLTISAFVSVLAIPLFVYHGGWSLVPQKMSHLALFALVGILHTALLWFYLKALEDDNTTTVVLFYSLLPVIGVLASGLFLGERLIDKQWLAMGITISGVLIIAFEGLRFKARVALLMSAASICWALGDVAFKYAALEANIWQALFWEHVVLTIIGLILFFRVPSVRVKFKTLYVARKSLGWKIMLIALISEVLYIVGNVVSAFPLLEVQVAAVHLVQTFQPAWVFLITLLIIVFRWVSRKPVNGYNFTWLVKNTLATTLCVWGLTLLAMHTP